MVQIALSPTNSEAYFLTKERADTARTCEMYVPPSNSKTTVTNGQL
jgi:hypothetical protein